MAFRISIYAIWLLLIAFACELERCEAVKSEMKSTRSGLTEAARNSTQFEASQRAHGSVFEDPFYAAPAGSENAPAGTLLRIDKETDTSLYTIPPGLSLARIMYQTQTSAGRLVPVTAYILFPYMPRSFGDGWPIVAWAHGTSGLTAETAPSNIRNLWHHFQEPFQLALEGYVVVATDYVGLGVSSTADGTPLVHEYLTPPAGANDVLYSVMAARAAFPQLSPRFVIFGHSEGGGVAWGAAQALANSPIVEGHIGTVAISPVSRALDLPSESLWARIIAMLLVPSIEHRYPEFQRSDVLRGNGSSILDTYMELQGTSSLLGALGPTEDIAQDNWQQNVFYQKYQELAANGGKPIHGPLLIIQGESDPVINVSTTDKWVQITGEMFPDIPLEYLKLPDITHVPATHASQRQWMQWIRDRFDGIVAQPGLRESRLEPIQPASRRQPETNWYLNIITDGYQQT